MTPVFLGGLFHLILSDRQYGQNEGQRCEWLWSQIQAFYRQEKPKDQLHDLTVRMVKPKKGSIELSGSGAQIRALIPFALQLVQSWEDLTLEKAGAKTCMELLAKLYACLTPEEGRAKDEMALGFQRNLQGLHLTKPKRWQMRPKLHMLLELVAEGGCPSASWNYREESFGGSVSRQSHRKGGWPSPLAMSRSTLTKFCAKERLPKLN